MTETTEIEAPLPAEPHSLALIAARVFDTPLLIHERKLQQILQVLGPRLGFDVHGTPPKSEFKSVEESRRALEQMAAGQGVRAVWNSEGGYYNVGSAAVIPVIGTLVQRSSWIGALSGLVSYADIEHAYAHALADNSAEEIIFELDTPGGEVAGAFDLADRIYSARDEKPTIAIASEFAASAGYLIASAAREVVLPRTGLVGSIGVVAAHVDRSEEMRKRGIAVTFVYAGEKKIDGNPYQPLGERARAEWQEDIDEIYSMFAATVARNRGLSERAVRQTEAGMYMGRKAQTQGLADRVNTFSNEVHNSAVRRGGAYRLKATTEDKQMTDKEKADEQKALESARAEGVAEGQKAAADEHETKLKAAVKAAAATERERIKAIVTDKAAEGRSAFAAHLAFDTEMTKDDAVKMLEASPKGEGRTGLAAAMESIGTPGIRSLEPDRERRSEPALDATAIYAAHNKPYNEALQRR